MGKNLNKRLLKYIVIAIVGIVLPVFITTTVKAAVQTVNKIDGIAELGDTKEDVINALGQPDSPQSYDFYYIKNNSEIVVCFDELTSRAQAIIVKGGTPKYSVGGIKIGDNKAMVQKTFGTPERKFKYRNSKIECWHYPSKNVYISFNGDKVYSFSISSVNIKKSSCLAI
jgi:outer membrane protein assembly factor BamE (lipoprotein component of BamABCDE complex)